MSDKALFIAEKPSVAQEFAKALKYNMKRANGYLESEEAVITWCVGHLVSMSYPEKYSPELKRWSFETIPFIPDEFKYEVIPSAAAQFKIVSALLNRADIKTIYVCTDSGREGEYIYRLVAQEAHVSGKVQKRVWIDSQTEEEIQRGIREAKDISAYDNLSNAAYLRAQADYLMGINFSRALTLKYGGYVKSYLKADRAAISVGRVMTCVLGMVVIREREIRQFKKTPFYRINGNFVIGGKTIPAQWRAVEGSAYAGSPLLYKDNGFLKKEDAEGLIKKIQADASCKNGTSAVIAAKEKKTEKKNAPLLFNLAELQNICSRFFKISPDETLKIAQELYEKKLTTYPRTDARVLSTAVAKVIDKNIRGLTSYPVCSAIATEVLQNGAYKNIAKSRYVNDKQITDHYAIIPTGQGFQNLQGLSPVSAKVYEVIVRRFLAIFYPPQVYKKIALTLKQGSETFFAGFKVMESEGFGAVMKYSFFKNNAADSAESGNDEVGGNSDGSDAAGKKTDNADNEEAEYGCDPEFLKILSGLKDGTETACAGHDIKEGETSPPKRYNSGSLILAMENAGQLIEDEEMRAQIKGSGIGTSATRADILDKLINKEEYLALNKKTQIITPTLKGEMVFDVVRYSIGSMLNPTLTASWEKGLSQVTEGELGKNDYTVKLNEFVRNNTEKVKGLTNTSTLYKCFDYAASFYKDAGNTKGKGKTKAKAKKKQED